MSATGCARSSTPAGFLTQASFTRLAQTLAYLTPSLLVFFGMNKDALGANGIPVVTTLAFIVGALLSFTTVWWSIRRVPELPLPAEELAGCVPCRAAWGRRWRKSGTHCATCPKTMRQLWWMALFQWYGLMCYWIYIVPTLAATVFGTDDAKSAGSATRHC